MCVGQTLFKLCYIPRPAFMCMFACEMVHARANVHVCARMCVRVLKCACACGEGVLKLTLVSSFINLHLVYWGESSP